jgi:biopolymer transport protein ExbD
MVTSPLKTHQLGSALQGMSVLGHLQAGGPQGSKKKKSLGFSINLTTLIDAFCILVIFLLANLNSSSQEMEVSAKVALPAATMSEMLNMGTVVKIEEGQFVVNDIRIGRDQLVKTLLEVQKKESDERKKTSIIIQADRETNFDLIGDILRAGGQVGFTKYSFAVLPGVAKVGEVESWTK